MYEFRCCMLDAMKNTEKTQLQVYSFALVWLNCKQSVRRDCTLNILSSCIYCKLFYGHISWVLLLRFQIEKFCFFIIFTLEQYPCNINYSSVKPCCNGRCLHAITFLTASLIIRPENLCMASRLYSLFSRCVSKYKYGRRRIIPLDEQSIYFNKPQTGLRASRWKTV